MPHTSLHPLGAGSLALTGMEFTDEVHWGLIFAPGGRLTSVQTGGRMTAVEGEPSHGRWHVGTDELCFGLGSETPRCHQVWASGLDVQLRRDGEPPQDGVLRKPGRLSGTGSTPRTRAQSGHHP